MHSTATLRRAPLRAIVLFSTALPALLPTAAAHATPVGTGWIYAECHQATPTCCVQLTFNDASRDVFGTDVNLGTSVGPMESIDVAVAGFDGFTGTYSGTFSSTNVDVFDFDNAGSFLCEVENCLSGDVSFVGDLINPSGTFSLPPDLAYTLDGTDAFQTTFPDPTIPGCAPGLVAVFDGPMGVNAFQGELTAVGSNVPVQTDTTFFNSSNEQEVDLTFDFTFENVTNAGQTLVRAYSNAAGEIPANFATQVNGSCVDNPAESCCKDSDCTTGVCAGCFHTAFAEITTTADYTGDIKICTTYPDADDDGYVDGTPLDEARLRFAHKEGGEFVDRTTLPNDPVNNVICATVTSFSFFGLFADTSTCPPVPSGNCRSAGKSTLQIVNDPTDDSKDKLTYKWSKGADTTLEELGTPATGTPYALCLYSGETVATVLLPTGGVWEPSGSTGYKMKDETGTPNGVQSAKLKSGLGGKASAQVKGKGVNLTDLLVPTLDLPVTAQLTNQENTVCFGGVYTTATKNEGKVFKASAP